MPDTFPELDQDWFAQYASTDPVKAADAWRQWLSNPRGRTAGAKYRKALELAVGVSPSAVGHYLSEARSHKLSQETRMAMDAVSVALGSTPSPRSEGPAPLPVRGARRIVLLAELADVPSPRYHLEVLRSIVRAGDRVNCSVAVHDVSRSDPEPSETIGRIVRAAQPHGVVWFRLTPDRAALKALSAFSQLLPAIVVHGARLQYPRPVIGHVIPQQGTIRNAVGLWSRRFLSSLELEGRGGQTASPEAVVIAMPEEKASQDFPPIPGILPDLRAERVRLVSEGLRDTGLAPRLVRVSDYSASQALAVFQQNLDAVAYVCLSDEIAVAIKHLLIATGRKWKHRILGFDDSPLSRAHDISSISQHLGDIGSAVMELFISFLRQSRAVSERWPECGEVAVEVSLAVRD